MDYGYGVLVSTFKPFQKKINNIKQKNTVIQNCSSYSHELQLKFPYSEEVTKFCEIFTILLTTVHTVKSEVKILQNFVAFSEYMNFKVQQSYQKFWKIRWKI